MLFYTHGVEQLQNLISDAERKKFSDAADICGVCKKSLKKSFLINEDIVFVYFNPFELMNRNNIPMQVEVKKQLYSLRSSMDDASDKHVVSNCFRKDNNWYLYDDMTFEITASLPMTVPRLLVYERKLPK